MSPHQGQVPQFLYEVISSCLLHDKQTRATLSDLDTRIKDFLSFKLKRNVSNVVKFERQDSDDDSDYSDCTNYSVSPLIIIPAAIALDSSLQTLAFFHGICNTKALMLT